MQRSLHRQEAFVINLRKKVSLEYQASQLSCPGTRLILPLCCFHHNRHHPVYYRQVSSLPDNNRTSVCPKGFLILGRKAVPLLADIIIQASGSSSMCVGSFLALQTPRQARLVLKFNIFDASSSKASTLC